jgi:polyhydroxybutyrate depolymerase
VSPRRLAGLALLALLVGACAADEEAAPTTTASSVTTAAGPAETASTELGPADRPARLVAPDEVTAPAPLVVLLHGFQASAAAQDAYLGVTAQAATRGLYVLLPDGTMGPDGNRFWDAAPACCNFTGTPVDDVGYLSDLIEEALAEHPIDPERVYLLGHSNGGFMSYRLACERADLITAVAVLAGAEAPNVTCEPSEPVSVLHLHGTADELILYDGGTTVAPYTGARETVARWVERDGCDSESVEGDRLDLVTAAEGDETRVQRHEGCDGGAEVQLDTLADAGHVPGFQPDAVGTEVLDWLLARTR